MEGTEWLRTQLEGFACGACGRSYRTSHISVLAQRDELFFVDLSCGSCGAEAVAIVTIRIDDDESAHVDAGDLLRAEAAPSGGDPVDSDDVLAMHEFLREFDGDFRALFEASGPSRRAPGT